MNLAEHSPLISGTIGGILAALLSVYWSKSLPRSYNGKSDKQLIKENKFKVWVANILFIGCLIGGVAVYQLDYFNNHDWRGFGLFFGLAFFLPFFWLYLSSWSQGASKIGEAFMAFALTEKMPLNLLYALMVAGTILFMSAIGAIL